MHSFVERIEEPFEQAAARARDIGAFLAESSQSTGGMIDRQFAGIRTNIEKERESTAAAMRVPASRPMRSSRAFRANHERFQSAAAELREMSREIHANSKRPAKPCAVAPPICRRKRHGGQLPCGVPSPIRSRRSRS